MECGWRDQLKVHCKEIVRQKGLENITVDDLVAEITPKGRALVPDPVKKELLQRIRAFLNQQPTSWVNLSMSEWVNLSMSEWVSECELVSEWMNEYWEWVKEWMNEWDWVSVMNEIVSEWGLYVEQATSLTLVVGDWYN